MIVFCHLDQSKITIERVQGDKMKIKSHRVFSQDDKWRWQAESMDGRLFASSQAFDTRHDALENMIDVLSEAIEEEKKKIAAMQVNNPTEGI